MLLFEVPVEVMEWACRGVVGLVQDIDLMQLLQERIQDACLIDIQVVPMGGVMVFVTTYGNNGARKVINDAINFF